MSGKTGIEGELPAAPKRLTDILDRLPSEPGVYTMKDARAKILYIGKAANLRVRVRQYFQENTGDNRDFVPLLEGIVADIETIVTSNEKEALLLENTLIKRHQPRFNVKLRDDKSFLVLRLDPKAEWPRLEVGRRIRDDGAYHFGPYHSATAARATLRVVNRHFQLRTCTDHVLHNRRRPCLQYQIGRCPAPCVLPVPKTDYDDQVRDVRLFLDGKSGELLDGLRVRMKTAATNTDFERAARLRDQLRALESTLQAQHMVSRDFTDQDVFGFHRRDEALEIVVMSIRQGKLVGNRPFSFSGQEFPDAEILSSFIGLYYDLSGSPPSELLLPFSIADADVKADWLNAKILVPRRGPRHDLVALAAKNAAASFASRRSVEHDTEMMLAKLQQRLKLPRAPRTIECYDISHVQGSDTVASMVVFIDGKPEKARYRTFKIQRAGGGDDFAAMYEVLSRRLRRAREADGEKNSWVLPDLIVVDGGKGQLAMALAAARDVGIDTGTGLALIALAKAGFAGRSRSAGGAEPSQGSELIDRVFLPHAKDAIPIRPNSSEMFVLQRLRDEAHRFAVGFHRKQRKRRTLHSELSNVPGIGAARQRALLRHFGSVAKIRAASLEDLACRPGMTRKIAQAVARHLAAHPDPQADSR